MTNTMTTMVAALAVAASLQTVVKAEDPISPMPGAVCNLYITEVGERDYEEAKTFVELAATMPRLPADATFVDTAGDFKDAGKLEDTASDSGMWTGWLKQEKAGTYTFVCRRGTYSDHWNRYRYSIWINGLKCVEAVSGQKSFNVDLNAGFNSVKIVTWSEYTDEPAPLSIKYKKAGSVKEATSFGPGDMWYDDEE